MPLDLKQETETAATVHVRITKVKLVTGLKPFICNIKAVRSHKCYLKQYFDAPRSIDDVAAVNLVGNAWSVIVAGVIGQTSVEELALDNPGPHLQAIEGLLSLAQKLDRILSSRGKVPMYEWVKKMSKECQQVALNPALADKATICKYTRGVLRPRKQKDFWHLAGIARSLPPDDDLFHVAATLKQHQEDYRLFQPIQPGIQRSLTAFTMLLLRKFGRSREDAIRGGLITPTDGATLEIGKAKGGNGEVLSKLISLVKQGMERLAPIIEYVPTSTGDISREESDLIHLRRMILMHRLRSDGSTTICCEDSGYWRSLAESSKGLPLPREKYDWNAEDVRSNRAIRSYGVNTPIGNHYRTDSTSHRHSLDSFKLRLGRMDLVHERDIPREAIDLDTEPYESPFIPYQGPDALQVLLPESKTLVGGLELDKGTSLNDFLDLKILARTRVFYNTAIDSEQKYELSGWGRFHAPGPLPRDQTGFPIKKEAPSAKDVFKWEDEQVLLSYRKAILERIGEWKRAGIHVIPDCRVSLLTDPGAARGLKQRTVSVHSVIEYIIASPVNNVLLGALGSIPECASTLNGWNPAAVLNDRKLPTEFKREPGSRLNVRSTGELHALSADLTRASDMTALEASRSVSDGYFHWMEDQLFRVDETSVCWDTDHGTVDLRDGISRMLRDERAGIEFIDGPRHLDYTHAKEDALKAMKRHDLTERQKRNLIVEIERIDDTITATNGMPMGISKAWCELNIYNLWAACCAEGTFQRNLSGYEFNMVLLSTRDRQERSDEFIPGVFDYPKDYTSLESSPGLEMDVRVLTPGQTPWRSHSTTFRLEKHHVNVSYFQNRKKSRPILSKWTASEIAERQIKGLEIPSHHEVMLRGPAFGEYPKVVNGDDFAAFWKPEMTAKYYSYIADVGLLLNPDKQGISPSTFMFSEILLNFRVQKELNPTGKLKSAETRCNPVDRIPLSRITLAKVARDKKGSVKGTNIESIAETVNTIFRTFKGFRKQALLRSVYQYCHKEIARTEREGIPLYWPKPLGGVGFEDKEPYAPVLFRKAAAVILSRNNAITLTELTKVASAWEKAIPSRSGRASLLACKRASDFAQAVTTTINVGPAGSVQLAQKLNDPQTRREIMQKIFSVNQQEEILSGERTEMVQRMRTFAVTQMALEKILEPPRISYEIMEGGVWTPELTNSLTMASTRSARKFLNDHIPAIVSRDFTLSRLSKAKELNIRSIAVAIKRRMSELTKRWGSVKPIDEKKAIALYNVLETKPALAARSLVYYVEALSETTSPRDYF
jgi:hypothetical protein